MRCVSIAMQNMLGSQVLGQLQDARCRGTCSMFEHHVCMCVYGFTEHIARIKKCVF
jgi:hypothetical protein